MRRLKSFGAKVVDLVDVYSKQIRCILELAAWQGSITQAERIALERVQKCACYIILGNQYTSYKNALKLLYLETLESRRKQSLKFAIKVSKHSKFKVWFKPNENNVNTSLAAKGAFANRLQRLQNPKWPPGGLKMTEGVWKGAYP